jgi:hypothetical protein
MPRLKPIVCKTPEELAVAMGLSAAEASEWQFQHALLKRLKEIVLGEGITHAEVAKRVGTSRTLVTSILSGDLGHVSGRPADSNPGRAEISGKGFRSHVRHGCVAGI